MRRRDFIRIGVGVSAAVVATTPGAAGTQPADGLHLWASRHGARCSSGSTELRVTARLAREDLGAALAELSELADGPIHCAGRMLTGQFRQGRFRIDLRVA